ncbi:hypothetical protein [Candidatus Amarolinea dominans]|uniref:hypothetical protein n=1 Tax=Candidatus Amarolinea dominans TaxID=3140696 RepID=UPI001DA18FE6|nr:hypothetical protein [Anaerolineae bacterium]
MSYDLDMLQEGYDETSHEIRRDRLRLASHDHSSLLFDEALIEALTLYHLSVAAQCVCSLSPVGRKFERRGLKL